jgi:cellulose synthase/poly-beta-1,6-N-acetylglucosamine synthase-like glycosyltransferase
MLSLFYKASAVRANRFVFAFEVPRLLNRNLYYKGRSFNLDAIFGRISYAHCVGHGLFIETNFAKKYIFPKKSVLEDMFYGFMLNLLKEPVVPLPNLDRAEVPNNLTILFYQMSRWFLGPSRTLSYFRYMKIKDLKSIPEHICLVLSGWYSSLEWLLTTPITILILFVFSATIVSYSLGFYDKTLSVIAVLALISTCTYYVTIVCSLYLHNYACKLSGCDDNSRYINKKTMFQLALIYPAVLLFHGFPAYYCILDHLLFNGKGNNGRKTERV